MDISRFRSNAPGKLVPIIDINGERHAAFVPNPLLQDYAIDAETGILLQEAGHGLGILNGIGRTLPNPHLLIVPFMTREALLSSRMEGTIATAEELFTFEWERPDQKKEQVREVRNYISALEHGMQSKLPVSWKLIKELHKKLLSSVRGAETNPGEFRKIQNAIGTQGQRLASARFVPPPPQDVGRLMDEFEKYIHEPHDIPSLVEMALLHYQFETIHPFRDGNGRIGRLLIPLMLCQRGILSKPLLYLSPFFDKNKDLYVDYLLDVSREGNWDEWVKFFLKAIIYQCKEAIEHSDRLLSLRDDYKDRIQAKQISSLTLALIDHLFDKPAVTIPDVKNVLKISFHSAQGHVNKLLKAGILTEITGLKKNRIYLAREISQIVKED